MMQRYALGVDSYQQVIHHMEVWSIRLNKTCFLPNYGCREYYCTCVSHWREQKNMEKMLDGNNKRMLCTALNKFWKEHSQNCSRMATYIPISQIILLKRTRHMGKYWRSKDEHASDVILWIPTCASVGLPARNYFHQFLQTLNVVWKTCREQWMIRWWQSQGNPCCQCDSEMMIMMMI